MILMDVSFNRPIITNQTEKDEMMLTQDYSNFFNRWALPVVPAPAIENNVEGWKYAWIKSERYWNV